MLNPLHGCARFVRLNLLLHKRYLSSHSVVSCLTERGILKGQFPETIAINEAFKRRQTIYAGFDATSDSLHLGHLVILTALIRFAKSGHQVICLIGDSTARIGDPTWQSEQRSIMDFDEVQQNANSIENTIKNIFSNYSEYFHCENQGVEGTSKAPILIRNSSWYNNLSFISFLALAGKHTVVDEMMDKNYLPHGRSISFAELTYQSLQAYDWFRLYQKYDCKYQMGGLDQKLNIERGCSLLKNLKSEENCCGLFVDLLTGKDREKMTKSGNETLWLNRSKISPFTLYQSLLRLPDGMIAHFLNMLTFCSIEEIKNLIEEDRKVHNLRRAHKKLAESVTLLVHGETGLEAAVAATKALFENDVTEIGYLDHDILRETFGSDTFIDFSGETGKISALDVTSKVEFPPKQKERVRAIEEGGFYLNQRKVRDPNYVINDDDILPNGTSLVRIGKKRYFILKWQ